MNYILNGSVGFQQASATLGHLITSIFDINNIISITSKNNISAHSGAPDVLGN